MQQVKDFLLHLRQIKLQTKLNRNFSLYWLTTKKEVHNTLVEKVV